MEAPFTVVANDYPAFVDFASAVSGSGNAREPVAVLAFPLFTSFEEHANGSPFQDLVLVDAKLTTTFRATLSAGVSTAVLEHGGMALWFVGTLSKAAAAPSAPTPTTRGQ